jgi:hypothetical protein
VKLLVICSALSLLLASPGSFAQSAPAKKSAPQTAVSTDEDDMVPDIGKSATFEYHCEMKEALTIYTNADDNEHIAMRWHTHLYRLKRIATTTGANRFENKKVGLVWIGIPSKGMLLDSRHGSQLANECHTTGQ